MSIFRRVIATILCSYMVLAVAFVGLNHEFDEEQQVVHDNNSLVIWYTDEAMGDYLSACAVAFHEEYGVRVIPQHHSGLDYIEKIYEESVRGSHTPDLFIVSNDALEKAYLSGVAAVIDDPACLVCRENFPDAAMNAVTYHGDLVGYPYYFETSALLYNSSYIHDTARNQLMASTSGDGENEKEEKQESREVEISEESIQEKVEEMLPDTIEELLTFADNYDAPENVESVFKWDVEDIFYNYGFVGNYMNVGGPCGDRPEEIDIYNMDAIQAMKLYQSLNQFFSFETEDLTYRSAIEDFMNGKLVMTVATSDIIKELEDAKKDGKFDYEYGLKEFPDLNDKMKSKSMSVTNTIVVNGYSAQQRTANDFATYLIDSKINSLYEQTGKIPCKISAVDKDGGTGVFFNEYAESAPVPKMMVTSNFWVELEITFSKIWSGRDVSLCLRDFAEMMMEQVTGSEYKLEYIREPEEEKETTEYLDEEAEKEAAKKEE